MLTTLKNLFKPKKKVGEFIHTDKGVIYLNNYTTHEALGNGKIVVDKGLKTERTFQINYDKVPASKDSRPFWKRWLRIK